MSRYVAGIRARIGHDLLLLPSVAAAVFDDAGRVLLARHVDDGLWGTVAGGVEPYEAPAAAVVREVAEETGLTVTVTSLIGVYGGPQFVINYPNGDLVSFTSTLHTCHLVGDDARVVLERDEVHQLGWFDQHHALNLSRRPWTDITLPEAFAWWRARH